MREKGEWFRTTGDRVECFSFYFPSSHPDINQKRRHHRHHHHHPCPWEPRSVGRGGRLKKSKADQGRGACKASLVSLAGACPGWFLSHVHRIQWKHKKKKKKKKTKSKEALQPCTNKHLLACPAIRLTALSHTYRPSKYVGT